MTRLRWLAMTFWITFVTVIPTWADDPSNARRPKDDAELRYWPGETQTLRGWLSFYEGTDIGA